MRSPPDGLMQTTGLLTPNNRLRHNRLKPEAKIGTP